MRGLPSPRDRLAEPLGRRATGIVIAFALEALLLLALLTLGRTEPPAAKTDVTTIDLINAEPDAAPVRSPEPAPQPDAPQQPRPPELPKPEIKPEVILPPVVPAPIRQPPLAEPPAPPAPQPARPKGKFGPPAPTSSGDSERVSGSGPNGEPLYAARWYREPYDSELSGYLSTARGPGWGLVACRTVADFRVDDCIGLDEYPTGSNITRAVLAAAWQFRVRPPRLGGQSQVGAWVRIRIDYGTRR